MLSNPQGFLQCLEPVPCFVKGSCLEQVDEEN